MYKRACEVKIEPVPFPGVIDDANIKTEVLEKEEVKEDATDTNTTEVKTEDTRTGTSPYYSY